MVLLTAPGVQVPVVWQVRSGLTVATSPRQTHALRSPSGLPRRALPSLCLSGTVRPVSFLHSHADSVRFWRLQCTAWCGRRLGQHVLPLHATPLQCGTTIFSVSRKSGHVRNIVNVLTIFRQARIRARPQYGGAKTSSGHTGTEAILHERRPHLSLTAKPQSFNHLTAGMPSRGSAEEPRRSAVLRGTVQLNCRWTSSSLWCEDRGQLSPILQQLQRSFQHDLRRPV